MTTARSGPGAERLRASALVCTKDRPQLIGPCLDALSEALGPDDELILVEAPGPNPARVSVEHPRFRGLVSDRAGKSHQLNVGLSAARGELILLTDDDVVVPPGWVEAMLRPFAQPGVGLVCGAVRGLSCVPGSSPPSPAPAGEAPLETWTFAHGAAMAVRREAAVAVGGFDERLGPGAGAVGEDHDFLLRVREAGWRVFVAPDAVAVHRDWRSAEADYANALAYERGGGAVVGAAIRRRAPQRWRLLRRRLGYQRQLLATDRRFAARAGAAFSAGLLYGLALSPRRHLDPTGHR